MPRKCITSLASAFALIAQIALTAVVAAQTLTPDPMASTDRLTNDQINVVVERLRDELEKRRSIVPLAAAQTVIYQVDLAAALFAVFQKRVDAASNVLVRSVQVDRSRTPQAALVATGRMQYVYYPYVVAAMPSGVGKEVEEVYFFKIVRNNKTSLVEEYEIRSLKPADLYALAAINEADPTFGDDHPNVTYLKDTEGSWYYVEFDRWRGERRVLVDRDGGWGDVWWFAGVRK